MNATLGSGKPAQNRALLGLASGFPLIASDRDSRVYMVVFDPILCDHSNMRPTALIVDDHAAFRASARTLLQDEGFQVVGEAEDGRSGLELARALDPDLVLLDVALPDLSGLDVAERLAGGHSKVVLVSSRRSDDFGARFRDAPVLGFISKDELSGVVLVQLLEESS
jgi:CheY-like chemotaxis protein